MKKTKLFLLSGLAMLSMAVVMSCSNPAGGDTPAPTPKPVEEVLGITPAILADTAEKPNTNLVKDGTYKVTVAKEDAADSYKVTINAEELVKHTNAQAQAANWIGFAMKAPEGANKLKYYMSDTEAFNDTLSEAIGLEPAINSKGESGIAFYFKKTAELNTTYCAVEWLKDGESLGKYIFTVDLSGVTLAPNLQED